MRNILKPAARTASSRTRRSVRGVAAVVASFALAAGLGSYPVDAQETAAPAATTATETETTTPSTSEAAPASDSATQELSAPNVTVERDGDIDQITIRDTDDNPWDSGRKASDEYIWGVKRTGEGDITRIVSVTADGEELDPQYFGYVNGDDYDVIGIDEDAFWTIPPMKLEIEVETTEAGEYAIAEPEEVPTARELSETGYGRTDQAAATVNPDGVGMARAAAPGDIPGVPGEQDQEFNLSAPKAEWVDNNPQLQFKVNEDGSWRVTRFAIKKDKNDTNTKDITGPVRIQVIRDGAVVSDRTIDPKKIFWGKNAKGKSYDTEFQLIPDTMDVFVQGGDTVILNPVGPPNGTYRVQMWGQDLDDEPQDHDVTVVGNGIPVSEPRTVGSNPYETTFKIGSRSDFSSAKVTLSPSVRLEDVFFSLPIEPADGVKLEHDVQTFPDRVEITWYPTKNGTRIDSVQVSADSTATLRTSYRSAPTRTEELVLNGELAPASETASEPRLPIAQYEDVDIPLPTPQGQRCQIAGANTPVSRKPPRELTPAEEAYGFRRFVIASPTSGATRYSSQLYLQVEDESGNLVNEKVGPESPWVFNALAYNSDDNYLYAVSQPRGTQIDGQGNYQGYYDDPCFPAGNLLQIDPYTGEVYNLGKIRGLYGSLPENHGNTQSNDLGSGFNAGTFDQGNFWVSASSQWGSGRLYKVDLDTRVATSNSTLPPSVARNSRWNDSQTYRAVSEDFVSLPKAPGYLFGLQSGWANTYANPGKVFLERIELSSGRLSRIDITEARLPSGQTLKEFVNYGYDAPVWGQAWLEPDGSIAFGLGAAAAAKLGGSRVVKVKISNPTAKTFGAQIVGTMESPTSYNTDGTSAPGVSGNIEKIIPDVKKEALDNVAPEVAGDRTFTARYGIRLSNPDERRYASYQRVLDTPKMPEGIRVIGATWTLKNEFGDVIKHRSQQGAGPFSLADFGEIEPRGYIQNGKTSSGTHTFEIALKLVIDEAAEIPSGDICEPNQSIYNSVTVGPNESDACTPPPVVNDETVRLLLAKVSSDNLANELRDPQNLLEGAEFTLTKLDAGGQAVNVPIRLTYDPVQRVFSSEELEAGRYRLTETKAPTSGGIAYSLLVKPIEFAVSVKDGVAEIDLPGESQIVAAQVDNSEAPSEWNVTANDAILAVANVRQGNMPKTGGAGLQLPILFGGALIAAGALMGRRKVAS